MRKRERENPCGVCGHYHKFEEGEVCGICGHRAIQSTEKTTSVHISAFSSEILPEFLYLGSYDNASRSELLKTQGISHILNTVPSSQNLYRNSFTYHCLGDEHTLPFDEAIHFLDECAKQKARVLVHCMSGKNRSPAFVIAYLMKRKGWKLAQSYQWVKERRPTVALTEAVHQQLQEYERVIFGLADTAGSSASQTGVPSFSFGIPMENNPLLVPVFSTSSSSVFSKPPASVGDREFTFGAGQTQNSISANGGGDITTMDSS